MEGGIIDNNVIDRKRCTYLKAFFETSSKSRNIKLLVNSRYCIPPFTCKPLMFIGQRKYDLHFLTIKCCPQDRNISIWVSVMIKLTLRHYRSPTGGYDLSIVIQIVIFTKVIIQLYGSWLISVIIIFNDDEKTLCDCKNKQKNHS